MKNISKISKLSVCSVCGHHIFPEKLVLYSPGVENLKQDATTKTKQKQKQRNRNDSNENISKDYRCLLFVLHSIKQIFF